jgi:hypothetical protein
MGLDAVVFRNAQTLSDRFGSNLFEVDATTGEATLKAENESTIPREAYFAVERRLGNANEVAWLRETIEQTESDKYPLILRRVLYSATHSGDTICSAEFQQLRHEFNRLKSLGEPELATFVDAMFSLLSVAQAERNPIVFV